MQVFKNKDEYRSHIENIAPLRLAWLMLYKRVGPWCEGVRRRLVRKMAVYSVATLSKAAASFSQLVEGETCLAKATALQHASSQLARLLAGDFGDDEISEPVLAALREIKAAFESLAANYDPPNPSNWRSYVAWNNLMTLYASLDL